MPWEMRNDVEVFGFDRHRVTLSAGVAFVGQAHRLPRISRPDPQSRPDTANLAIVAPIRREPDRSGHIAICFGLIRPLATNDRNSPAETSRKRSLASSP